MTQDLFERVRAIDIGTHITEPPDVWTARVSTKKWGDAVHPLPDNVMWKTDFAHPTCQHPGLEGGATQRPAAYAEQAFQGIPDDVVAKVLQGTAARLYKIE